MHYLKKSLPVLLLFVVVAMGGISTSQAKGPGYGGVPDAPQCNCRNPNVGSWGVLAPDPNAPGEDRCEVQDNCWIPVVVAER